MAAGEARWWPLTQASWAPTTPSPPHARRPTTPSWPRPTTSARARPTSCWSAGQRHPSSPSVSAASSPAGAGKCAPLIDPPFNAMAGCVPVSSRSSAAMCRCSTAAQCSSEVRTRHDNDHVCTTEDVDKEAGGPSQHMSMELRLRLLRALWVCMQGVVIEVRGAREGVQAVGQGQGWVCDGRGRWRARNGVPRACTGQ